jgi:FkbM family methyltransferase
MSAFFYRHFPRLVFALRRLVRANYEREMELLDLLCERSRTGIDVGAKVGMYTYRIRARSSEVVAFEPIPLFNRMLRAVFEGQRARIEPCALSNHRGKVMMRLPFDHDGSRQFGRSTIDRANALDHPQIARVEQIEVETQRLDDYNLTNVGFIKIDVEGHELAVLDGGAATIDAHHPNMLIECNDDHHPQASAKLAIWLRTHDYDGLFIDGLTLCSIETYEHALHWGKRGIENFICVHRSRADVRQRLTDRVAARKLEVPRDTLAGRAKPS